MIKMTNYQGNKVLILRMLLILLLPFLLIPVAMAVSDTFVGKCVSVHDGDTLGVMHNGKEEKIRVWGIDCPELHQDFGSRAKQFTSDQVFGKIVTIEVKSHDRYGRTVGRVKVDGKDLSLELAKSGMAWYYRKYSNDQQLASAEKDARDKKIGLWSAPNPLPPWDFRKNRIAVRKNTSPKASKSPIKENSSEVVRTDTIDTAHGKRIIHSGPNSGKYYINKKGKKVYIEK